MEPMTFVLIGVVLFSLFAIWVDFRQMKNYLEGFVGDEDPMEIWNVVFTNNLQVVIYNRLISTEKIPWNPLYDFSVLWRKEND